MDYCEWLSHMNPYHDSETGRFTTKDGTYLVARTRLNSVSGEKNPDKYKNGGKWLYTYRDDEEWDNKIYKGPFSYFLRAYRGIKKIYEHRYETTKDLKMPTREERIEEFKNLNKENLASDLESIRSSFLNSIYEPPAEMKKKLEAFNPKNIKTKADWDFAYELFSHLMERSYYYKSTQEYMEHMSSKWDAMVDDNNKNVYNRAVDPIIIFRANETLRRIGHLPISKLVSDSEIRQNLKYMETELAKKGERVKL